MRFSHFFSLLPLTLLCHSVLSHCSLGNPLLPSRLSHEVGLLKFLCFTPDKFPQYAENCSRKSPVAKWCFQRGRSADSLSTSKKGGGHTGSPPQRSFFLTLTHPFVLFFPSRNPASRAFCRIPGPRSAQARNRRRHVSFLSQLESLTLHDFRPCISSFASYQDPSNSPLGGHKGTASREERSPAQRCPLVATTARFSAALSGQFSAYHEQKMVPATPQKRRKCSAGAPQRDPAGAVRTLCMKRDKLDFADKLAEKAQATSPPVNSASPRSPGVRGKQALPRQVKQGSGTTAKEEKITTKAAGDGSDDGHGAATVKAEKPEDGATIASPAGTTNAPRKGKRSKDECDETQEGEAGKDDGEVKTEAKPAKHAAGKKGHAAQNAVPDEPDEVFLKHRALAESSRKFLGAHISAAGGVQNAPLNCLAVGGQAFAFFLKNQRRWDSPPISDESADEFKASVARLKLDGPMHILPHGSYLINLANPDSAKRKVSYNAFLDDLKRCEQVGVHRYVFHPGSTVGNCTKEESIQHVAECLNKAIAATKSVTILVENMAGQKNVLCSQFEDLRDIISLIDNKDRIGVCLDTCHLYSAGHDIRTEESFEAVMKKFDSIVGMSYLKGMHINDSKAPIASGLDRHEHLGKGTLGMAPFKFIMQHPTWFKDMPLILETPEVDNNGPKQWRRETQMMYSFIED